MSKKYQRYKYYADGEKFLCLKEGQRFLQLKQQLAAGNIKELSLKVNYPIVHNGIKITSYRAEFVYFNNQGELIVEDCKEARTPLYRLKKKLMQIFNGIEIKEI